MNASHSIFVALFALAATPALAGTVCYELEEVAVYDDDGDAYTGVSWWGVNNKGVFSGDYCLDEACSEVGGAIYDSRDGSIELFSIEGYTANIDSPRINDRGQIAGSAMSADGDWVSFVRDADGDVTLIEHEDLFIAQDINNRGQVAGFLIGDGWPYWQGAVLSGEGYATVDTYEMEGALGTALWSINDAGHVAPSEEGVWDAPFGYLQYYDDGKDLELVDWTDAGKESYLGGTAWAINNKGQVAGALLDFDTWAHPGFVKTGSEWQIIEFDGKWTAVLDINDHGVIAGTFDAYDRGFVGFPVECE